MAVPSRARCESAGARAPGGAARSGAVGLVDRCFPEGREAVVHIGESCRPGWCVRRRPVYVTQVGERLSPGGGEFDRQGEGEKGGIGVSRETRKEVQTH